MGKDENFPIVGYNVTFMNKGTKHVMYNATTRLDNLSLFMDGLQRYTTYQLVVFAFNRFDIHSPNAEEDFTTSQTGNYVVFISNRFHNVL